MEFEVEVTRSVRMKRTFRVDAPTREAAIEAALDQSRAIGAKYGVAHEKIDRVTGVEAVDDPDMEPGDISIIACDSRPRTNQNQKEKEKKPTNTNQEDIHQWLKAVSVE
jgi:hypothetical protein